MRRFLLLFTLTSLLISAASQKPSTPSAIAIHMPAGWKQTGQLTFERSQPETVAVDSGKGLSDGHQSWRLDPRNIAAECLLEFRLVDGKDLLEVANKLGPGDRPEEFVVSLAGNIVTVTVQTYNHVPIAQHLQVVDPCEDPRTTIEMRACAWKKYLEADGELNKVYKTLMGRIDDRKHREMLIKAQSEWIKFRDSSAEFEAYFYEGGTIKAQIKVYTLERVTRARTKELREIIADSFDR